MLINLLKERECITKLLKKYLVIAQAFSRMGDNYFACEYFSKADIFAQKLSLIDSQLNQNKSTK